jgi:HK97 family phage portal protein
MSVLARLLDVRSQAISSTRQLYEHWLNRGVETDSGAIVNEDTAMRVSAVYSCVNVLAQDVAKLPLIVYKRLPRGKDRAPDYWLSRLLNEPNPWQTGFEFRAMLQAHTELCGNFYALMTVLRGEVVELLPIPPGRVTVEQYANWQISYKINWPDGTSLDVPADRMFHHRGLSLSGVVGISPIAYQRETIGLAMQMVKHGSRLFKNGALLGGVLEHPGMMSDPAAARLKESFEEKYAGVDNAHKVILLEEGTKFNKTGLSAEEAQFLESRKLSRTEICGFYRVPPHKIGDLERATFSNVEQQSTDYVIDGLLPRITNLDQRIMRSLMPKADRATYVVEHLVEGLLRGDYATRMAGYNTSVMSGWMTRNEVREKENMNPGPAELDEFLTPLNMDDPGRAASGMPDPKPPTPANPRQPTPPERK